MKESTKKTGDKGEEIAEAYLKVQGYKILAKNLSCRYGEIDIVAQKKNHLFFVEIRRRIGETYGSALESITKKKLLRIRKTAQYYLGRERQWEKLVPFFSVVAIDEDADGKVKIEFLPDAYCEY